MSRSPVISTLLILTLCIVCEVTSAPREERIREESEGEKFLETREAELLERRSDASRSENFRESREEEMRKKRMTLVQAPSPSVTVEEKKTTTKKPIVDKPKGNSTSTAENSEAKDMRQSHVDPKDDDDSAGAETVPEITEKNSTSIGQQTKEIADKDSVETPKEVADKVKDKVEGKKNQTDEKTTVAPNKSPATTTVMLPVAVVTDPSTAYVVTNEPLTTSPETSASTTIPSTSTAIDSPGANVTNASTTTTTIAPTATTTNAPTTITTDAPKTTATDTPTTTTMNAPTAASTNISTGAITSTGTSAVVTTPSSANTQSITDVSMTSTSTETYSSAAESALHAKRSTSMPPGVVALVIAIAFACVSVMAYIGLVVWRRYLEWRYGNRELLVNEFDANDISNFEL